MVKTWATLRACMGGAAALRRPLPTVLPAPLQMWGKPQLPSFDHWQNRWYLATSEILKSPKITRRQLILGLQMWSPALGWMFLHIPCSRHFIFASCCLSFCQCFVLSPFRKKVITRRLGRHERLLPPKFPPKTPNGQTLSLAAFYPEWWKL